MVNLKTLFVCTVLFFVVSALQAQDIPDPDFLLKPYFFQNGKLDQFETVDATAASKAKGMTGSVEMFFEPDGKTSPVRFATSSTPEIIVKTKDDSDPSENFVVIVSTGKKERHFTLGLFGGKLNGKDQGNRVKIIVEKIRDRVYKLKFENLLPAGEYIIITNGKDAYTSPAPVKIYLFGID